MIKHPGKFARKHKWKAGWTGTGGGSHSYCMGPCWAVGWGTGGWEGWLREGDTGVVMMWPPFRDLEGCVGA